MANYLLLVQAGPDHIETGIQALAEAEQLLAQGHQIEQVFFYGPGVAYGHHFLSFPSGLPNLQAQWQQLASQHTFPLIVCATVGSQYGLEAVAPPAGNLAHLFHGGGLAEFMSCLASVDYVLQFPYIKATHTPTGAQVTFLFTQPALHPSARHGLDMLLMAASLELPTAVVFDSLGLQQLVAPTQGPDPLKKYEMLADIFDFEEFYTTEQALQQAGITTSDLRVPVNVISEGELGQLTNQQSKHVLRF